MASHSAERSQSINYIPDPEVQRRFDRQEEEIRMLCESVSKLKKNDMSSANKSEEQFGLFAKWLQKCHESANIDPTTSGNNKPSTAFASVVSHSLSTDKKETDDDSTTEDIPGPCVEIMREWFRGIHNGNEISEILKLCLRPKNCDSLVNVEINDEIKKLMDKTDQVADQRLKWLSNGILKAAGPLATAWGQLLRLEFSIQQKDQNPDDTADPDVEFDPQDAMIPLNHEEEMNLSEIIRHIKLSLKTIGFCHVQAVQKRHLDLKDKLSGAAKELAEPSQPFTDLMFGPDLAKKLEEINAAHKMTAKLTNNRPKSAKGNRHHPFLGLPPKGPHQMQHAGRGFTHPRQPPAPLPAPWYQPNPYPQWQGTWQRQPFLQPRQQQRNQSSQGQSQNT